MDTTEAVQTIRATFAAVAWTNTQGHPDHVRVDAQATAVDLADRCVGCISEAADAAGREAMRIALGGQMAMPL